jgi:hypothetical protein
MRLLLLFVAVSMGLCLKVNAQPADSGTITIHADPRLALVVNKPQAANKGFIGKRNGYRVQIYNGNDRKKASQAKLEFMRAYPSVRSYLTYNNPQFRVRVGDFLTRKEATEFYNKVSSTFNPSMVVPDVVNVNTVKGMKEKSKSADHEVDE